MALKEVYEYFRHYDKETYQVVACMGNEPSEEEVQAIFNQSKENFVLERDSVDLASHCHLKDEQEVILPDGFVVIISE